MMPAAILPFLGLLRNPVVIGVLCFSAWVIYTTFKTPRVDIAAIERNAIAGRDAHWQSKLREKEREHDAEIQEAIAARDAGPAVPESGPELDSLCKQSATCRD